MTYDTYTKESDPFGYGMRCCCDCGCDHNFAFGDSFAEQFLGVASDGIPIVQAVCIPCGIDCGVTGEWESADAPRTDPPAEEE